MKIPPKPVMLEAPDKKGRAASIEDKISIFGRAGLLAFAAGHRVACVPLQMADVVLDYLDKKAKPISPGKPPEQNYLKLNQALFKAAITGNRNAYTSVLSKYR